MFSYIIKKMLKEILLAVGVIGIIFLFAYSIWSIKIIGMTKTINVYILPFVIMYITGVILFIVYRILDYKKQYDYREIYKKLQNEKYVWKTIKYEDESMEI